MEKETPVFEYSNVGFPGLNIIKIRMYEDGILQFEKFEDIEPDIRKEFKIPQEQVKDYAERLIQSGFFDLDDEYSPFFPILDGSRESINLNYQGRSKSVICENSPLPSEKVRDIIDELGDLVTQLLKVPPSLLEF